MSFFCSNAAAVTCLTADDHASFNPFDFCVFCFFVFLPGMMRRERRREREREREREGGGGGGGADLAESNARGLKSLPLLPTSLSFPPLFTNNVYHLDL